MKSAAARVNGEISFWHQQLPVTRPRPALPGDVQANLAIAGAGLSGLWTAYYVKRLRPDWRVVIVDREHVGFGASGRNGGWLTDHFSTPTDRLARTHGRESALALRTAMQHTIDEVVEVCRHEGIEADIHRGGHLAVARGSAQDRRLREELAHERSWGLANGDTEMLDRSQIEERLRVSGATSAVWYRRPARLQPAKLVRGLGDVVERLGVEIYESTTVRSILPGQLVTDRGIIRAESVLSCLEGYTPSLRGERRSLLPLNSAMIVTDPLPQTVWDQIGWQGSELFGDTAHAYCYAQRTADDRIAIGGRGVPYRFGSRTDSRGVSQPATVRQLVDLLHLYFPATASVAVAHAWCGVLGVPRDWASFVRFDPSTRTGMAGGYVGNGLSTTNLAGRTMADLVTGADTELVSLPWVGQDARRRWEPEPLRWLGSRLVYGLYRSADRREAQSTLDRDSRLASAAKLVSGR